MTNTYRRRVGRPGRWARWLALLTILSLLLPFCGVQADDGEERRPLEMPDGWPQAVPGEADYVPGRVLVLYEEGASAAVRSQALSAAEAAPVESVATDLELVEVPVGQELSLAEELNAQPGVLAAQPDYYVYAQGSPDDPYLGRQWFHTLIGSIDGWDLTTGSPDVTVAVIDSGIDLTHPDLSGRIIYGRDYIESDNSPNDEFGHGTHVAGLVGAMTDNGVGVAGMDWQADLLIIRVLDASGGGSLSNMISGIDYAIDHDADVINMSLGGYFSSCGTTLQNKINEAYNAGIVVIAAMVNDGTSTPMYPAACDHVIAVAATDRTDSYAYYSNWGDHVDIAAPGGEIDVLNVDGIYSTMPTYAVTANESPRYRALNYDYWSGTSMAAPLVSGLSALLLSADPTLTPDEVEDIMTETAVDLGPAGWDEDYGSGRIDAANAIGHVLPPPRVTDFGVASVTEQAGDVVDVSLVWTPPAQANSITIYRSTAPITEHNWNSADVVVQGLSADTSEYLAEDVPYTGGMLYFALRADGAYLPGTLWSEVSNNGFWPPKIELFLPIASNGD